MINKDIYRQVQIAILSGIADYKDDARKEVWWTSECGYRFTLELLNNKTIKLRSYYNNGNIACKMYYKNGQISGKRIGYFEDKKVRFVEQYKDGKLKEKIVYLNNGKIVRQIKF